eukprot:g13954.t1
MSVNVAHVELAKTGRPRRARRRITYAGAQTPKILFQRCMKEILQAKCFADNKEDAKARQQIYEKHKLRKQDFAFKWKRWKATVGRILVENANNNEPPKQKQKKKNKRKPTHREYSESHKLCTRIMQQKGLSAEKAAKEVEESYGISPHPSTLRKFMKINKDGAGSSPRKKGRVPAIPPKAEAELVDLILHLDNLELIITIDFAAALVKNFIQGSSLESTLDSASIRRYVYRLIRKPEYKLSLGKCFTVESSRLNWGKAYIISKHYDAAKKILLETGFATENPQYEEGSGEPQLFLREEGRILSFDETKVKLGQTDDHLRSISLKGKKKSGAATQSSTCMSCIASTTAAGGRLQAYCVWQAAGLSINMVSGTKKTGGPSSNVHPYLTPLHAYNDKGSVRTEECLDYFKKVIVPAFPDLSSQRPIIVLMDGCLTHLRYVIIKFCVDHHIILLQRPPHTTHLIQPEDVFGFGLFKKNFAKLKAQIVNERMLSMYNAAANGTKYNGPTVLTKGDLMDIMKGPWETAFSRENVLTAWRKVGISPFSRCVEERLKKQEAKAAQSSSRFAARKEDEKKIRRNMLNFFSGGKLRNEPQSSDAQSSSDTKRKESRTVRFWKATNGAITEPNFVKMVQQEHEKQIAEEEAAKKLRERKAHTLKRNVAEWKKVGEKYWNKWKLDFIKGRLKGNWNDFKEWPEMSVPNLKCVLAFFDVYPNQKPPVKYKYGNSYPDLFREVLDKYKERVDEIEDEVKIKVIFDREQDSNKNKKQRISGTKRLDIDDGVNRKLTKYAILWI